MDPKSLTKRVAGCPRGWPDVQGFPMDSRGIRGERRRKADAEATNTKNTTNTHSHNKKIKDALLTPVIELVQLNLTESLGEEKPYLPKGGSSSRMNLDQPCT